MSPVLLNLLVIITYFKLRENQNNPSSLICPHFIITYFKLRENQNVLRNRLVFACIITYFKLRENQNARATDQKPMAL